MSSRIYDAPPGEAAKSLGEHVSLRTVLLNLSFSFILYESLMRFPAKWITRLLNGGVCILL